MAFPILLVTFIFVCQILNVFTYDILGSYAAFAAARSYAVNRNAGWDKEDFDLDANRIAAAKKAYGIAVAIMATYSIPSGKDEEMPSAWSPESDLGISGFIETAKGFAASPSSEMIYAAHRRLSFDKKHSFRVIEYSDEEPCVVAKIFGDNVEFNNMASGEETDRFSVPMKAGYGYPESGESPPAADSWWAQFWQGIMDAAEALLDDFHLKPKKPDGYPVKVARVAFVYDYPTVFARLGGRYLSLGSVGSQKFRIPIYQSCAMPIEPIPTDLVIQEEVETPQLDEKKMQELARETKRKEDAVNAALTTLFNCTSNIQYVLGDPILRPDRQSWPAGTLQWTAATKSVENKAKPPLVRVNPAGHRALSGAGLAQLRTAYRLNQYEIMDEDNNSTCQVAVDERPIQNTIRNEWAGGSPEKWLFDPKKSLEQDNQYRKDVEAWCQKEIDQLRSQTRDLNAILRLYDKIEREEDSEDPDTDQIDDWQDSINDKIEAYNSRYEESIRESRSLISNTVEQCESDEDTWTARKAGESPFIDGNDALKDGCLKQGLGDVEQRLSEYYRAAGKQMELQNSIMDTFMQATGQ